MNEEVSMEAVLYEEADPPYLTLSVIPVRVSDPAEFIIYSQAALRQFVDNLTFVGDFLPEYETPEEEQLALAEARRQRRSKR